jgi:hypothetical protein
MFVKMFFTVLVWNRDGNWRASSGCVMTPETAQEKQRYKLHC